MKLSSLLNEELIFFEDSLSSQEEVIKFVSHRIADFLTHEISKERIEEALLERELLKTTVVENGVSIPHARIEGFNDLLIAILILKNPVTVKEKEAKLFFVVITYPTSSRIYLNTLKAIAQISSDESIVESLLNADTPGKVIDIISATGIKVKDTLTVVDIMNSDPVTVGPELSLKELLNVMTAKNLSYVPVINENGRLLGEVNAYTIIDAGIPNYALMVGNLSFLSSFEPFEELLEKEKEIKVRGVMREPVVKLSPETSIIELAFKLTNLHKFHAPVVDENNKVLGVVSLMDIVNKILRV